MSTKMFVNLPVSDLKKTMVFYKALGFKFNPQFTDDTAACMVISDHNYAMLLTHEKWAQFSTKPIPDARKMTGVLIALALESENAVDVMVEKAFEAMMTMVKIDIAALEAAVKRKQRSNTVSYIDGFVIAVPTANKQKFIDHAKLGDGVFMDLGATRILECWGDDVADGKLTDFRKAVQAKDDETIVFSWIEWPDKATRDAAHSKMVEWMQHPEKADPRMHPEKNPMPFDGKRLIFGGFTPLVELESSSGIKASS